jgi:phosphohistidine phosphatase
MSKLKQILLLRHAKSSWADPLTRDYARTLNERGKNAAYVMGRLLDRLKLVPELILCSGAVRTRETYEGLGQFVQGIPVEFTDAIYEATVDRLLKVLQAVDEKYGVVMMIGHNPGMENLTKLLTCGAGNAKAQVRLEEKFPTGALAVLKPDSLTWTGLGQATCTLEAFFRPADQD